IVVYDYDIVNNRVIWGLNFASLLGYPPGQYPPDLEAWQGLIHPEDISQFQTAIDAAFSQDQAFAIEYRVRHRDGHYVWVADCNQFIRNNQGQPITVVGTISDISQRKESELQLATSEASLQEAQRVAKIGSWEWNAVDNTEYWSEEIYYLLEFDPQQVTPSFESLLNRLSPEERQKVQTKYQAHLQHQQPYEYVYRLQTPEGRWKHIFDRVESIFDDQGQLILTRGTCQDVTATYRYQSILQQLVDGTASVTGDNFFNALVENLALALEVEYAIVSVNHGDRLQTLAWFAGGILQPNMCYMATNTPCEKVVEHGEYCCFSQVQLKFPDDHDLARLGAEAYLGVALKGETGETIGHLCVLHTQPWSEDIIKQYQQIMRIFAARASVELQRDLANDQLQQLNQSLGEKVAEQTRLLTEKTLFQQSLLDSTDYMIVSTDTEGIIKSVNAGAEKLYGYSAAELIGKATPLIFNDPEDLPRQAGLLAPMVGENVLPGINLFFEAVRKTGRLDIEVMTRHRNGHRIPLALTLTPLTDADQMVIGFLGIGKDISREKSAIQALEASERRYDVLVASSPVGIFQNDAQGSCIYGNDRCFAMTGLTPESGLGMGWGQTLHPEDRDWVVKAWQKFIKDQSLFNEEYRFVLPDGSITWVMGQAVVDQDGEGNVVGYLGTLTDITKRKQAELDRQTAIAQLEEVVAQLQQAQGEISQNNQLLRTISKAQAAFIQADDRLTIFGELLTDLLELTDSEYGFIGEVLVREDGSATMEDSLMKIRGVPYLKAHSITNIAWNEATQKLYEDNYEQGMEFTNMNTLFGAVIVTGKPVIANSPRTDPRRGGTPDGHPSLDAFLGLPFFRGNTLMGMVGIANRPGGYDKDIIQFLDPFLITCSNLIEGYRGDRQRRQAEAQLQLTNQELLRATRLKDEFLANMSHELRTPLNAILGNTEILQEEIYGPINDRQGNTLAMVEKAATHLLALITDILDVAKMEAGQLELSCGFINIADLCNHCLAFIKHQALKKQIQLDLQMPPQTITFWGDDRRLSQVLINLLNNAVKFTPENGTITVMVSLRGDPTDRLRLSVADTGIGIAPENLPKLFKPFIQIDSALNRQYEGTGLGLTLVKQITELHSGEVGVVSEFGQGSCFWIDLPYNPDINEVKIPMQDQSYQSFSDDQASSFPLILLAEDNETNAYTTQSYLEAIGNRVVVAENGAVAIELAQSKQPDIILMDIQMPELDGLEAIRRIRQDPKLAKIPIIALTALAMDGDQERCLEAGANVYLSKPVRLKELVNTIQQLLAPPSP
ncbi:MAG: hypothetical protein RLZZ490_2476, partial [Cyanobacteriota bacterium]